MGKGRADEFRDQLGLGGAHMADGDIGLAAAQVADLVRHHDLHVDPRRAAGEVDQDRWQDMGGIAVAGRDAHMALDARALAGGRQRQPRGRLAHGAGLLQKLHPRRGQHQRLADALEKGHAKGCLQPRHLPPKGGLRQPERAGGSRKRALLDRREKRADLVPVIADAAPIHA